MAQRARIIVLVGAKGSGKTTLGRRHERRSPSALRNYYISRRSGRYPDYGGTRSPTNSCPASSRFHRKCSTRD